MSARTSDEHRARQLTESATLVGARKSIVTTPRLPRPKNQALMGQALPTQQAAPSEKGA
jgi:hypothetical protein